MQVEDEMSDTQDKLKSLKKRVKDDVEKLEKKIRALGSKVTDAELCVILILLLPFQ